MDGELAWHSRNWRDKSLIVMQKEKLLLGINSVFEERWHITEILVDKKTAWHVSLHIWWLLNYGFLFIWIRCGGRAGLPAASNLLSLVYLQTSTCISIFQLLSIQYVTLNFYPHMCASVSDCFSDIYAMKKTIFNIFLSFPFLMFFVNSIIFPVTESICIFLYIFF